MAESKPLLAQWLCACPRIRVFLVYLLSMLLSDHTLPTFAKLFTRAGKLYRLLTQARKLPVGGKLYGIELDPTNARITQEMVQHAGLSHMWIS